jgi:hypothetical protein
MAVGAQFVTAPYISCAMQKGHGLLAVRYMADPPLMPAPGYRLARKIDSRPGCHPREGPEAIASSPWLPPSHHDDWQAK